MFDKLIKISTLTSTSFFHSLARHRLGTIKNIPYLYKTMKGLVGIVLIPSFS